MQTQAIGLTPNFTSRRHSRQNIDNFINADDRAVRQASVAYANHVTQHEKHEKLRDVMLWSVPVVAGVAAALLTKGNSKLFGKTISGTAAKLANGLKNAGIWGGSLAAINLVVNGKNELSKKSENVRNFDRQHPFLSIMTTLTAVGLALHGGAKGISYLANKVKPTTLAKIQTKVGKFANKINSNSFVKAVGKNFTKLTQKIPAPIKNVAKVALFWAPNAILIGSVFHSINHEAKRNAVFANTYATIKDRQFELAKARNNEMKAWREQELQELDAARLGIDC